MTNEEIAARLEEVADFLETDPNANTFRVAAYREGAMIVRHLREPAAEILARGGRKGLEAIPHIGEGLSGSIEELVRTGHLGILDRLREEATPEAVFAT